MPRPRKCLVCRSATPYYHCTSRCVRRAFLCGKDKATGQSYEHRRQWIVERIHLLASLFAIDICSYAVMSNHYHLVVKLGSSESWSDEKVIQRWLVLYRGPLLARQFLDGRPLSRIQRATIRDTAVVWRNRLQDLSWFMKCLNEPIARMANREDDCSGHFWEARFTSQALTTERALLTCMAYVDLNPVRAGLAKTPLDSDYTGLQQRLSRVVGHKIEKAIRRKTPELPEGLPLPELLAFSDKNAESGQSTLPFGFEHYKQLVAWTCQQRPHKKPGKPPKKVGNLLSSHDLQPNQWLFDCHRFEKLYRGQFRQAV